MVLGVGAIGADGDPANLMYAGVLAVGIVGAISRASSRVEWPAREDPSLSSARWAHREIATRS
jgi:hypothetical protein